ncbi:hypothetical protein M413DRAFT_448000 [Hebeloma cylindrosporum]|uniref:CHAT domain-containing protein n=1 Tax=Hebeloma cylindrosporum TaxID=76867 RepID=A0A0C3C3V7_HEBCY|nr:hypothetical protein M413DRAFT_448000 [Hebeloma cylindrosporum h7]
METQRDGTRDSKLNDEIHEVNGATDSEGQDEGSDLEKRADEIYTKYSVTGDVSYLNDTVTLLREGISTLRVGSKDYVVALDSLGASLTSRFDLLGRKDDMEEAISFLERALEFRKPPHPERPASLVNLAHIIRMGFDKGVLDTTQEKYADALDKAVSLNREALALASPADISLRLYALHGLEIALQSRSRSVAASPEGDQDLNEAVSILTHALELESPDDPAYTKTLDTLATIMRNRVATSKSVDFSLAVSLHRQVIERRPPGHDHRPHALVDLTNVLYTRFQQEGRVGDLDEAISLCREARALTPPSNDFHVTPILRLAVVISKRYEHSGLRADLDESIALSEEALSLLPHSEGYSQRSDALNDLALVLISRYDVGGQMADMDRAIALLKESLEATASGNKNHKSRLNTLNNLAEAYRTRYPQTGDIQELDEAILLLEEALREMPTQFPNRGVVLGNLAHVFKKRYDHLGHLRDLDRAISLDREVMDLIPISNPHHPTALCNLADALATPRRVDEAIKVLRQAVELFSPTEPNISLTLMSLAIILTTRFFFAHERQDLDEAIVLYQRSLKLMDLVHPYYAHVLQGLANALQARYDLDIPNSGVREDPSDLDEGITLLRRALKLSPPLHTGRPRTLSALATALGKLFRNSGDEQYLNEAFCLHEEALKLVRLDDPLRATTLSQLGDLYIQAHDYSNSEKEEDRRRYLERAMENYSLATKGYSESPYQRYNMARKWAGYADAYRHPSALEAYDMTLQILPQVAGLSMNLQSRQEALTAGSDGLARKASICAIRNGDLDKAVEFLEAGRAIFWAQVLNLRTPLEDLRSVSPELERKLRDISAGLERGSHRNKLPVDATDVQAKIDIDREGERLNRLNEEYLQTLAEVRKLEGFEDFLRPSRVSALQEAVRHSRGPVVFLVENEEESRCLVMTSSNVRMLSIPGLPTKKLGMLVGFLQGTLHSRPVSLPSESGGESTWVRKEKMDDEHETLSSNELEDRAGKKFVSGGLHSASVDQVFRFVLRALWDDLVRPLLELLDFSKSDDPPVLNWCPTGLFSFLPIHAAGIYASNGQSIDCASDYIVSSFTPTIGALLVPEQGQQPSTHPFKFLAVIQAQTLPFAKEELRKIESHIPAHSLITLGAPGSPPANVDIVVNALSSASIVHFACHGEQDEAKPLESALILQDGRLPVSRIMQQPMPGGSLAFLSACETAMGDKNLPDEAMSLGASLLFSGFKHIIATMWSINDRDGPTVADAFYKRLFQGADGNALEQPNPNSSARALHDAVKRLRAENVSFRRWVPFIHMGR